MLALLFFFILGLVLGYAVRSLKSESAKPNTIRRYQSQMTHQQKLYLKSMHQTDSDRIRELNKLSSNQSIFTFAETDLYRF